MLGYGCTYEASRETLVATLPIGYHDGYMRALSNRGRVVVRGAYAPVVGRISMDLTLLDVTNVEGVATGDRVTLLGEDGELLVPAEDSRALAGRSLRVTCGSASACPTVRARSRLLIVSRSGRGAFGFFGAARPSCCRRAMETSCIVTPET